MEVGAKNSNGTNFKSGITYQNIDKMNGLPINYVKPTLDTYSKHYTIFMQILNHWIGVPAEKLAIITDITLDLITFVAVDDIYDSTALRKGNPTTHKIFGIANTVNAFDFLMCGTLETVTKLNHPKAMAIYLKGWRLTLAGQGMEVYWRDNYLCPTEEEFDAMVILKASSWHLSLRELMQLFGDRHRDTEKVLSTVGLYFQIVNDYNCLTDPKHFASRGFCDDISEGKFTIPIVHAINCHPEVKEALIDILKQRTKDIKVKRQFLAILEKCGSFEYTRNKLKKLELVLVEEVEKLGGNPHLQDLIKNIWDAV